MILRLLSCLLVVLLAASPAAAAEVLQVRTASLLQVGDGNRTYTVQLACIEVEPAGESAAVDWLRQELPRRRRVHSGCVADASSRNMCAGEGSGRGAVRRRRPR